MGRLFWRWILFAAALILAAKATGWFVSGFEVEEIQSVGDGLVLLVGAAVLALLNATLGKVIKFLALPITCLTLGLFSLVINAAMLQLAGTLELGFRVDNFAAALVGSIILSIVNALLGMLIPDEDEKD
ncbi:MAG: phage holin family protein [Armatimonadetes bacterium]|nr:phage holin family protein [Armatimonadota bacterium]